MAKASSTSKSSGFGGSNDWWNNTVGSSMLMSSIGSLVGVGSNIISSFYNIAKGGSTKSSSSYGQSGNSFFNSMIRSDQMYTRISKYPSKTTISYGGL